MEKQQQQHPIHLSLHVCFFFSAQRFLNFSEGCGEEQALQGAAAGRSILHRSAAF